MTEMTSTSQGSQSGGPGARVAARVLWNSREVIALVTIAFVTTSAIVAAQLAARSGVFDPAALGIFMRLFLFQDYPAAIVGLLVLLVGLVPAVQEAATRLARAMGSRPWVTVGLVVATLGAGAFFVYHAHPLAMDESSPYMQSAVFAAGRLTGHFPPALVDWLVPSGFQGYFISVSHESGRVASAYWPGFALLLTPFTAAGIPWLCNPVLAGLALLVIQRLARELAGTDEAAGSAMLYSIASAAFTINGISFYSMTAHLLCNATFALLLLHPSARRALLAGAVGGFALILHNPVPHLLFALPWIAWMSLKSDRRRFLVPMAVGYLPFVAGGFAWYQLGINLAGSVTPAGAATSLLGRTFDLITAVFQLPTSDVILARCIGLAKLWIWASPALLLLAIFGFARTRTSVPVRLLAVSAALTFFFYFLVPADQGHGWGYRYFHSAWFILPIFAALLIGRRDDDRSTAAAAETSQVDGTLARYGLGAALGAMVIVVPLLALNVREFIGAHLAQLPHSYAGTVRVVIIDPSMGYYAQDLVQNDPFLRDRTVRLFSNGRRNDDAMMAREFPELVLLGRDYRGSVWGAPALGN